MNHSTKLHYPLVILIIVLLNSCQVKKPITDTSLHRQWMLKEMKGMPSDEVMKNRTNINMDNNAIAYAGCNKMYYSYKAFSGNNIKFKAEQTTLMNCEGLMEMERLLQNYLLKINKYSIEGHMIYLYHDKELLIKAIAADWD